MISHRNVSERYPIDELDGLMRWALRERVGGASPPPRVWERIRARAEWRESWMLSGCKWVEWRYNPWLTRLLDQYSSMLKFAC